MERAIPRERASSFLVILLFFRNGMRLVASRLFFLRGELYGEPSDDFEERLVLSLQLAYFQGGYGGGGILGKPAVYRAPSYAMFFGKLGHRLAGTHAFEDLFLYVRVDVVSLFGHTAVVSLGIFTLTAFRQSVQDSGYPSPR